jgi:hypothetical protein
LLVSLVVVVQLISATFRSIVLTIFKLSSSAIDELLELG